MSDLYVTISFAWEQVSADPRQYNQQRTLLRPLVQVAVDIPLKHEYIWNAEEIIQAQLQAEGRVIPVLTPLGMVYADNVLRAAYEATEIYEEETSDEDIEWQPQFDEEQKIAFTKAIDNLVNEKLEDDSEFPVEELIDGDDEDELDEILWEN